MSDNTPDNTPDSDYTATPIGFVACGFLIAAGLLNTVALFAIESMIYAGLVLAILATAIGFIGLTKNRQCIASNVASGIGIVIALGSLICAIVGVEVLMS